MKINQTKFKISMVKDEFIIRDILDKIGVSRSILKNLAIQSLIDILVEIVKNKKLKEKNYEMIREIILNEISVSKGNVYIEGRDYVHSWEKLYDDKIEEKITLKRNNIKKIFTLISDCNGIQQNKLLEEIDLDTGNTMKVISIIRDEDVVDKINVSYFLVNKRMKVRGVNFSMNSTKGDETLQYILGPNEVEEIIEENNLLKSRKNVNVFYKKMTKEELEKNINKCKYELVKDKLKDMAGIERGRERGRER